MSGPPGAFLCGKNPTYPLKRTMGGTQPQWWRDRWMAVYEKERKAMLMQDFPSNIKPDWKDAKEYEKVTTMTSVERWNKASLVDSVYRYFQINLPQLMVHVNRFCYDLSCHEGIRSDGGNGQLHALGHLFPGVHRVGGRWAQGQFWHEAVTRSIMTAIKPGSQLRIRSLICYPSSTGDLLYYETDYLQSIC
jgi:hypothetical protein